MIMVQGRHRVLAQRPSRDLGGHEGVAVSIPADPGAELEEGRHVEFEFRVVLLQGAFEKLHHLLL